MTYACSLLYDVCLSCMTDVLFHQNAGIAGNRQAGNQYRVLQQDGKIILVSEGLHGKESRCENLEKFGL